MIWVFLNVQMQSTTQISWGCRFGRPLASLHDIDFWFFLVCATSIFRKPKLTSACECPKTVLCIYEIIEVWQIQKEQTSYESKFWTRTAGVNHGIITGKSCYKWFDIDDGDRLYVGWCGLCSWRDQSLYQQSRDRREIWRPNDEKHTKRNHIRLNDLRYNQTHGPTNNYFVCIDKRMCLAYKRDARAPLNLTINLRSERESMNAGSKGSLWCCDQRIWQMSLIQNFKTICKFKRHLHKSKINLGKEVLN